MAALKEIIILKGILRESHGERKILFGNISENEKGFSYTSVGGWLLIFCLYLIVVTPLAILYEVINLIELKSNSVNMLIFWIYL